VLGELKVPQAPLVLAPQLADQLAPLVSLLMFAVRENVLPTTRDAGAGDGVVLSEIEGEGAGVEPPPPLEPLLQATIEARTLIVIVGRMMRGKRELRKGVLGHDGF
jgi:hypothetical protein